jgi:hypothetical protein
MAEEEEEEEGGRRVMRVWQRRCFYERGFLLFIGVCCFSFTRRGDFEEEDDEEKSSGDRRTNNACTKNGLHKEDCCMYILSVSDYFLAEEHLNDLLEVVACTRRRRR